MGMINYMKYNGKSSLDFGLYIGGQKVFDAPKKDITKVSVPGRNGDIIIDKGTFSNITITYMILGMNDFRSKTPEIKSWLLSPRSYSKIEDTYDEECYRMGILTSGINYTMYHLNKFGKAQIKFDCMPQRFLKTGDYKREFDEDGYIFNPTEFTSKPIIDVVGYGDLYINSHLIRISNSFSHVTIDSSIMDCYSGSENANSAVQFATGNFPEFHSGKNTFSFASTIDSISIIPKWWTL